MLVGTEAVAWRGGGIYEGIQEEREGLREQMEGIRDEGLGLEEERDGYRRGNPAEILEGRLRETEGEIELLEGRIRTEEGRRKVNRDRYRRPGFGIYWNNHVDL